jgi:hypothetical protein
MQQMREKLRIDCIMYSSCPEVLEEVIAKVAAQDGPADSKQLAPDERY